MLHKSKRGKIDIPHIHGMEWRRFVMEWVCEKIAYATENKWKRFYVRMKFDVTKINFEREFIQIIATKMNAMVGYGCCYFYLLLVWCVIVIRTTDLLFCIFVIHNFHIHFVHLAIDSFMHTHMRLLWWAITITKYYDFYHFICTLNP